MNIYELLRTKREEILYTATKYGAYNVRIFGSVARQDADAQSDIDFLVEMQADKSLFDLGGLLMELQELLGRDVDIVTEKGLRKRIRERVLKEASINQPILAAALTQSLDIAEKLPTNALTTTNYGICATLNNRLVVKAPDWSYIPSIKVPREEVKRSYTPRLQGDIPIIVMEFLSDTEGGEYSSKPTYPPGKWFFYEQILQVPNYAIFEPDTGVLEVYKLDDSIEPEE